MKKRLIICADGTWNKPDQKDRGKRKPTNVVKLARAILPRASDDTHQVVFYDQGVGTSGGLIDHLLGGATGLGVSNNIQDCYRFLVHNYSDGDEVYLFGFSRGAFTVRSLAGLIERCGLLTKDDAFYIPDAYAHYRLKIGNTEDKENKKKVEDFRSGKYKARNSKVRDIKIKFIGVWDTVGALGIPTRGPIGQWLRYHFSFHNVKLGINVENAYQALAIDERRKPFEPTLWTQGDSKAKLEQVWFAGVHTNVGGGYEKDGLANCAFQWMLEKAESCGLEFDKSYIGYFEPEPKGELRNSMTWFYRLFGQYLRPLGLQENGHEAVHQTALDRLTKPPPKPEDGGPYKPENLLKYLKEQQSNNQVHE